MKVQGFISVKEICAQYQIHRSTLRRRLRDEGIELPKYQRYISPAQVRKIYQTLGEPD